MRRAANLVALLLVLGLNGAAASGAMSGNSIGVIANQYRSLFLPANYVFGIWSVIYLGLIASVVYQLLPTDGSRRAVLHLGPWWMVSCALNIAWISLFSFAQFGLALIVMVIFLLSLIAVGERVRHNGELSLRDRLLVVWPQDLYLAWISVALIANSFQFAQVVGWNGAGLSEATWSVAMMGVATLLGVVMAWGKGNWIFPLVVAWAVRGIGVRYADVPALANPAGWLVPIGLASGAVAWIVGHRRLSLRR